MRPRQSRADLDALIGKRFAKLTIKHIERVGGHPMATCLCDCGGEKTIRLCHIVAGRQLGCGCGRSHTLRHGKSGSRIYAIWRAMRARCENENDHAYAYYGARGIRVCERWKTFDNFYKDMGDKPHGMSVERRDVNGNYSSSNCEWASHTVQMNNTRRSRRILYRGQTLTVADAMRLANCKIPERTVRGRIDRGIDAELAMTHKGMIR